MPMEGGRPIRGDRPSRYGLPDEDCEEAEIIRLSNLEVYASRASAGLPIFEDPERTAVAEHDLRRLEAHPVGEEPGVTAE